METAKRIAVGLATAGVAVMLLRKVFVEGEYLIAAMWSLLLLWLAHPSGQRAYLERRARDPSGPDRFQRVLEGGVRHHARANSVEAVSMDGLTLRGHSRASRTQ